MLGPIRRPITEIKSGNYAGYKDESGTIRMYIDNFSPQDIVTNLTPILSELNSIDQSVYEFVCDNPHEEINGIPDEQIDDAFIQAMCNPSGESRRDLMRKEVTLYKEIIGEYIDKYSSSIRRRTINDAVPARNHEQPVLNYRRYNARGNIR